MVIDIELQLHRDLGPGLLESVYEVVLAKMLKQRGLSVERQKPVPIHYQGVSLDEGFRLDLLVDGQLIVELRSVKNIRPVHPKQLLTYPRLMNLPLGLLINFGSPLLKDGLQRVVNKHTNFAPSRASTGGAIMKPVSVAIDDGRLWNVALGLLRLVRSAGDVQWP